MIELSVIIPTRNRAELLRRCLVALEDQTLDRSRFEVLVVDNGSSDGTVEVVESLRRQSSFALRYLFEPRPGLHNGRHLGMTAAASEFLVFADDDIVPSASWLEAIHEAFDDRGATLVGGPNLPDWETSPPRWLHELWQREKQISALSVLDLGEEIREVDPRLIWGCNFSIRRSTLVACGGFHPDAMPQDLLHLRGDGETYVSMEIARTARSALYHPRARVAHFVPAERMAVQYFQRRAFAQGISDSFTELRARGEASRPRGGNVWNVAAQWLGTTAIDRLLRVTLSVPRYLALSSAAAHRRGFVWHQRFCAANAQLADWVLKPSFIDEPLPDIQVGQR